MKMVVRPWLWIIVVIVGGFAPSAVAGTITDLFVFGDSLSDTGNVLNRTNAFSIFVTPRPTVPWYDTGRWTNGTSNDLSNTTAPRTEETAFGGVWHERLADELGIDRATNSLAGGNNWAYGGATTAAGTFSSPLALKNIRNQVDTFLAGNPTFADTQLFAVWGGGNDVRDAASAATATVASIKAAATTALANTKASIAALAGAGAKSFLWPNLPPLEKTPEGMGLDATKKDGLKQASELFRDSQAAAITMLLDANANIQIKVLDIHGMFLELAASPGDFGITNITGGVITASGFGGTSFTPTANFANMQVDADAFLFWDQIHPTARTHDLIGIEALAMVNMMMVPEPSSALLAMMGLVSCWLTLRRRMRG